MKSIHLQILLFVCLVLGAQTSCAQSQPSVHKADVTVGAADTAAYFSQLRGKRIAVLANHTSMVNESLHLVDMLHDKGFDIVGIFSPEHGFRGDADAGAKVGNSVDERTQIKILSLYNGSSLYPVDEVMKSFDLLVVDLQDVGLRFYTYYITMLRMIDACSLYGHKVIVLDRPNPNGFIVDGPVLDMKYKSGVGALPIPVVHGLTMGEIAVMAMGEGWSKSCDLQVVKVQNYTHDTHYDLPIAPSPNLKTQHAIYLYPSTCLFEGTVMSLGRGTDYPFEVYGHPQMRGCDFSFTPRPTKGALNPPLNGEICYGVDLRDMPYEQVWQHGFDLSYIIESYNNLKMGDKFFIPFFEKLVGVDWVRTMIVEGKSADEIREMWQPELSEYKKLREKYLIYK